MVEVLLLPVGKTISPERKYQGDNAFGVLGISPQSSFIEIKRAYRELASQYHPDKNSAPEARGQFIMINEAYNFIIKGGEIAKYLALCDIAQPKQRLVEALRMIKMTKILTGVDLEEPRPNPNNDRGFKTKEEWEQQQRLFIGLQMRCPSCKYKNGCNIATGFDKVEDVYQRIIEKAMNQIVKNTMGTMLDFLFKKGKKKTR